MDKNRVEKNSDLSAKDEKLLPDLNSSSDMKCDICDKHFTDAKSYEDHMKSKAHQKMAIAKKVVPKASVTKESDEESNSDDDDDDDDDLFCDVCDKRFNNYTSYITHINGNTHAKKLKKQKLKKKMSNMPELVDQENEDEGSDNEILQTVYARCAPCKKAFSGPESFALHIQSANHKKKIKQSKLCQNLKAKYQDETNELDETEFYDKCKTCDKSFSGVIPYQIHMKSAAHKKELEKLKVAEEIKEFLCNDSTKEEYVCKECKKTFTNPLAFKSHLENNSHEKRKAKAALKDLLNAYPEIIFTTPLDDQTKESGTDDDDADYFLICKICSTSFSGPESAQDHVKSKKHISLKKKKEMLKILKKQKEKENSEITNGKNTEAPSTHTDEKPQLSDGSLKKQPNTSEKNDGEKLDDFEMI